MRCSRRLERSNPMSSTNRGAVRNESDFYPTPASAFRPLLPYLAMMPDHIWEPACGDGRLVKWMREVTVSVAGDDLTNGYDFLKDERQHGAIITNPPFSLALEFCRHAVTHAPHVFMLLRLGFLASEERRAFWQKHPASALLVLCKRPNFVKSVTCKACGHKYTLPIEQPVVRGDACPKCSTTGSLKVCTSDSADYAWVYWGSAHRGIFWL